MTNLCVTDAFNRADTITTTTYIADAFDRADAAIGTADTGGAWTVQGGAWNIRTNRAACTDGTSRQDNAAVIDAGVADVTIQVDVPVYATQAEAGAGAGIAFRSTDVSNRLQLIVFTSGVNGAKSLILQKIVAGTPTSLSTIGGVTPASIKVVLSGSSIQVYSDDGAGGWTLRTTVTETFNQTATKHGLTSYWSAVARLDNFTTNGLLATTGLGSADTGQAWTLQSYAPYDGTGSAIAQAASKLGILSNQAASADQFPDQAPAGIGHVEVATIDSGFPDVDIAVDLSLAFATGGGGGTIFRWAGAASFWQAFLFRSSATFAYYAVVRKVTATSDPTYTELLSVLALANGTTGSHRLRVVARGSLITAYVDGTSVGSFTDSYNSTATNHGIETYGALDVRLDNFSGCPVGGWVVGAIAIG